MTQWYTYARFTTRDFAVQVSLVARRVSVFERNCVRGLSKYSDSDFNSSAVNQVSRFF